MNDLVNIVPEVRRLRLLNAGIWESASFDFSPRLNLIRGWGATGKSTILRALLPSASVALTARFGAGRGELRVEYARTDFRYELTEMPETGDTASATLSTGENVFRSFGHTLDQAKSGSCLLTDEELFDSLDVQHCAQAVEMIHSAECQCIMVVPFALSPEQFRQCRVFGCAIDRAGLATVQRRDL